MRKLISAMQLSLDGFIEGENGSLDWIETWEDTFDILSEVDALVLGSGMYAGYEEYWLNIHHNPAAVSPYTGKKATDGEIAYAAFAVSTPHYLLTSTIQQVKMQSTTIIHSIDDVRRLKARPGKAIHLIGGAATVSRFLNEGLVDEIRLTLHPIILGSGKQLYKDITQRWPLELKDCKQTDAGNVCLVYAVRPK